MSPYSIEWTTAGYVVRYLGLPVGEPPFRTHDQALAYVEREEQRL